MNNRTAGARGRVMVATLAVAMVAALGGCSHEAGIQPREPKSMMPQADRADSARATGEIDNDGTTQPTKLSTPRSRMPHSKLK